jgi:hypothetical protein
MDRLYMLFQVVAQLECGSTLLEVAFERSNVFLCSLYFLNLVLVI